MTGSRSDPGSNNDGLSQVDKLVKNELLDSGIDPLQIGYNVDDFGFGASRQDFEFGDGDGGDDGGGYGTGGNNGQGPSNPDSSDGLRGLEWWCYWQWNRAVRVQKRSQTTLHFSYNNRHQLVDLVVLMLASELLPPRDMAKATLATMQAIEDLLPLLLQIMCFPIIFPLILSEFQQNETIFAATVYGILGASVTAALVISGAVVYGLWRWQDSFQNHDSSRDDTDL
ncbi:hypothetical protein KSS87_017841 [Heliosperma pusillum]|nr:hypothetical protein KSS87_017841 [Heliosperma pusillum]